MSSPSPVSHPTPVFLVVSERPLPPIPHNVRQPARQLTEVSPCRYESAQPSLVAALATVGAHHAPRTPIDLSPLVARLLAASQTPRIAMRCLTPLAAPYVADRTSSPLTNMGHLRPACLYAFSQGWFE
jgi:hypothetical protein